MQGEPVDHATDAAAVDPADPADPAGRVSTADVERLLDELQRDSQERRAQLRELAAQLPEATSRRALLRSMASGIVHAPNRPLVAKRVVLKLARTPSNLVRRGRSG